MHVKRASVSSQVYFLWAREIPDVLSKYVFASYFSCVYLFEHMFSLLFSVWTNKYSGTTDYEVPIDTKSASIELMGFGRVVT